MQGFGQIQTVYTSSSMPVSSYSQTSGLPIIQQYTRPVQVVEMHPVQIVDMPSPPPPHSPKIIEKIVEVEKPVDRFIEVPTEKIVHKEIAVPIEKIVVKEVEVPVEKIVLKEIEVPVERVVERVIEKEIVNEVPVEKIIRQDVEVQVQKIVKEEVQVPVERIVKEFVEVPVEKIVVKEVPVEVERVVIKQEVVEVPVDKIIIKQQEVPIVEEKIVEKIVTKEVQIEPNWDLYVEKQKYDDLLLQVQHLQLLLDEERKKEKVVYQKVPVERVVYKEIEKKPLGKMVGLGLALERSSNSRDVVVHEIIPGFAAERSGSFQVGDVLVAVDQQSVYNIELDVIKHLTVGPVDTYCTLQMMRGEEIFNVTLQRVCPPVLNYSNYHAASQVMSGETGIRSSNYTIYDQHHYSNGTISSTRMSY